MRFPTFVPGEVPAFQSWLCHLEERCGILRRSTPLGYRELEVRVGVASIGLGAVDGGVDLEADVKELSGEEIDSVSDISDPSICVRCRAVLEWHTDRGERRIRR